MSDDDSESMEDLLEAFQAIGDALGEDQRTFSLNDAFDLGAYLGYLRMAAYSTQVGTENSGTIIEAFDRIDRILQDTSLDSTIKSSVIDMREDIGERYDSEDTLSNGDSHRVNERADSWIDILRAEIEKERRIEVQDVGLFDVEAAMDSPHSLFDQDVWKWLTPQSQEDISEACRTLAVNCPTACVMLSLRAVEDCLRRWHKSETGEKIEDTWGRVLGAIAEEYPDKKSQRPSILSNLDYLLDKRNEVMHPQESPSLNEATTTLFMARQTIAEIYEQT